MRADAYFHARFVAMSAKRRVYHEILFSFSLSRILSPNLATKRLERSRDIDPRFERNLSRARDRVSTRVHPLFCFPRPEKRYRSYLKKRFGPSVFTNSRTTDTLTATATLGIVHRAECYECASTPPAVFNPSFRCSPTSLRCSRSVGPS